MHVAAFFASGEWQGRDAVDVCVYCERPLGIKGGAVGEPAMRAIGKYVRTHARHFRQQSDYTVCAAFDEELFGGWRFHRHDPVFWSRGKQDYLWKFDLPSAERIAILKSLDQYNLNAFSLFDSQETLLETMRLREQISESGAMQMEPASEVHLPFTSKKLAEIFKEHGYETHPKGMAQPLGVDIEQLSDGKTAYFDVNADAVRKNGEVPERPIRLTFERAGMKGGSPVWTLKSVGRVTGRRGVEGAGTTTGNAEEKCAVAALDMSLEETLIKVWRKAFVENAKVVELDGEQYPVRRTPKRCLRQVDFMINGKGCGDWSKTRIRNPAGPQWHALARRSCSS